MVVADYQSTIIYKNFSVMTKMKRGKYPVRTLPKTYYGIYDLWRFPNFHYSGSVAGMKNLYYGLDAKLVRCGDYIYNVSSQPYIYDNALEAK